MIIPADYLQSLCGYAVIAEQKTQLAMTVVSTADTDLDYEI